MIESQTILLRAGALRDAVGVNLRPGAVLLREGVIVAVGEPQAIERLAGEQPDKPVILDLPDRLVMPALVNAHAHLDLTTMGRVPYAGVFADWGMRVMRFRADQKEADIHAAVREGLRMSRESGVGWIGDIAGSPAALDAFRNAPAEVALPGVGYLERFGIGSGEAEAVEAMRAVVESWVNHGAGGQSGRVKLGLQPHAPYSAGPGLFMEVARLAALHGLALSTHLAETVEELQFLSEGGGMYEELFKQMGRWDGSIKPSGKHPVDHLAAALRARPWLLAHCNYVDDAHIRLLAECGASVAYCPIASEYFGHTGHRYREMLAAGINVCLGTDSILCQPAGEAQPLGILPAIRRLYRRDGTRPDTLLRMATVNGLKAMGIEESQATFTPGVPASLVSVRIDARDNEDALVQVLRGNETLSPVPAPSAP
ncbi:MAG: amidohydrolase family protein [Planctomycetes bacterium]|nr:amidohydrolase family protein [Planctomycetota bacterium]